MTDAALDSPTLPVRVEVVELDGVGNRQISTRRRTTELLSGRREDIRAAVVEAVAAVQAAAAVAPAGDGWRVSRLEAVFGITLTAEAGVIVSRASAEASFGITVALERG